VACEGRRVGHHLDEAECFDRLRLALESERLDLRAPDCVADKALRLGADENPAVRCGLLEPCGDVHGIAGDERLALPADDDLARVDADPRLEPVL